MTRKCIPRNRDKNLHSFAEEHKHGLIFCKRLEEGLIKNFKIETITNYVKYFWNEELSNHFKKEEDSFLHLVNAENSTVQQFIKEHKEIKLLYTRIITSINNKNLILKFLKLLRLHITFEASIFFPYVESVLTDEQLSEIGKKLTEKDVVEDKFESQFWQ